MHFAGLLRHWPSSVSAKMPKGVQPRRPSRRPETHLSSERLRAEHEGRLRRLHIAVAPMLRRATEPPRLRVLAKSRAPGQTADGGRGLWSAVRRAQRPTASGSRPRQPAQNSRHGTDRPRPGRRPCTSPGPGPAGGPAHLPVHDPRSQDRPRRPKLSRAAAQSCFIGRHQANVCRKPSTGFNRLGCQLLD